MVKENNGQQVSAVPVVSGHPLDEPTWWQKLNVTMPKKGKFPPEKMRQSINFSFSKSVNKDTGIRKTLEMVYASYPCVNGDTRPSVSVEVELQKEWVYLVVDLTDGGNRVKKYGVGGMRPGASTLEQPTELMPAVKGVHSPINDPSRFCQWETHVTLSQLNVMLARYFWELEPTGEVSLTEEESHSLGIVSDEVSDMLTEYKRAQKAYELALLEEDSQE